MKIDKSFSDEEKKVLKIMSGQNYEKYVSKLEKDGGFVCKIKRTKLPFLKDKLVPIFVSKEFLDQVMNRARLYDIYPRLNDYKEKKLDTEQMSLCHMYINLIDKVQNTCRKLKDDEKTNEFLQFLAKKCVNDISLDVEHEQPSYISRLPLQSKFAISKIAMPTKEELQYMKAMDEHMDYLASENQEQKEF